MDLMGTEGVDVVDMRYTDITIDTYFTTIPPQVFPHIFYFMEPDSLHDHCIIPDSPLHANLKSFFTKLILRPGHRFHFDPVNNSIEIGADGNLADIKDIIEQYGPSIEKLKFFRGCMNDAISSLIRIYCTASLSSVRLTLSYTIDTDTVTDEMEESTEDTTYIQSLYVLIDKFKDVLKTIYIGPETDFLTFWQMRLLFDAFKKCTNLQGVYPSKAAFVHMATVYHGRNGWTVSSAPVPT